MRWKTAQKKARLQRKVRLAALTLFLIIAVIFVGNFAKALHTLFSPLSAQTARTYSWDSNFNLNLVLTTKPLSVLSLNPVENKIAILEIPDNAYIEVPGGFGSWKSGAIYKLGEAENPPKGAALLKNSFESFLALPIDGIIEVSGQGTVSSEQFVKLLRGNPIAAISTLTNSKTDLSPVELVKFVTGVRGVRFDKIQTFNLQDLGLLTEDFLADGTDILVGDPIKIDALLIKHFADTKILDEAATIAVLNSTGKSGLAGRKAQIITHIGGNVIIQASFNTKLEKNYVEGDQKYPYTSKRLKQIFGSYDTLEVAPSLEQSAPELSRASVNLILGQQ